MPRSLSLFSRTLPIFTVLTCGLAVSRAAADDAKEDLAEYRTVDTAISTRLSKALSTQAHQPGYLGVRFGADDKNRLVVADIEPGSPAAKGELRSGDVLVKWSEQPKKDDGGPAKAQAVFDAETLRQFLQARAKDEVVHLEILREKKRIKLDVNLGSPSRPLAAEAEAPLGKGKGGWDTRAANTWKKDVYRLAVIPIDFTDIKHNEKITRKHWEESLFSKGTYKDKSVTGQTVYGSMNDYYHEVSYGTLRVEGKVFDFVPVSKKGRITGRPIPKRCS